jgi:transposase-like protein
LSKVKSSLAGGLPAKRSHRFPPTAAGIQVNHCKNPKCGNFGVPPKPGALARGGARTPRTTAYEPGDYMVTSTGKDLPALKCHLCGEITPMQSNLAIAEELLRISDYLEPVLPRCPNEACAMSTAPAAAENVTRFGTNQHGTPRYKCVGCRKAFSFGGKSTKRQRRTAQNRDILQHLMNAMPLRRIIKVLGISPNQLYDRIDFLHKQAQLFAGARERTLVDREDLGKRYVSVDRQKLVVNWHSRDARKNTTLLSIATADQATGFVFAVNVNFDPALDPEQVERDMLRFGDPKRPRAFRRYARVWLPADWDAAAGKAKPKEASSRKPLEVVIEDTYAAAQDRPDIEDGEGPANSSRAPTKGMLLHEQTVMYAHIQLVSRLLHRAEKIRFFTDQESGIRAAILTSVPARVKARTADAFYVKVLKEMTVDQKRGHVGNSKRRLKAMAALHGVSPEKAELLLAQEELTKSVSIGKWGDRWFKHPISDMREPEKSVCWLTDIDPVETDPDKRRLQVDHQALLHLKATLTAVDRFFMQVRRGLTLAERAVASSNSDKRLWHGKSAYNPEVLVKVVGIFRTYFNYCEVGQDGKTPAMRLGLARGPVAPEDIVYFTPDEPKRRRAAVPLPELREDRLAA